MSIRKRTWVTGRGETREAWVVNYTDQAGTRRIATFQRKRDAETYQAQAASEVRAGTHSPIGSSITVTEAIEDWLERAELEEVERATLKQYRELGAHICRRLGMVRLAGLTTPRVNTFCNELRRDLSRSMTQKILTALKGVLAEAQRRGTVAQNTAIGVTLGADKRKAQIEVGRD